MADDSFNSEFETQFQRLARKSQKDPLLVIGVTGCLAACAIGAYKYKYRGAMSTSVYLMQMRVIAQGTVIGSLSLGMVYHMYNSYMNKYKKTEE